MVWVVARARAFSGINPRPWAAGRAGPTPGSRRLGPTRGKKRRAPAPAPEPRRWAVWRWGGVKNTVETRSGLKLKNGGKRSRAGGRKEIGEVSGDGK